MIMDTRLDVLNLKEESKDYFKYFKGLDTFIAKHDKDAKQIYTMTYCNDDSWTPLAFVAYKYEKNTLVLLFNSKNALYKKEDLVEEGYEILIKYLTKGKQRVKYGE